MITRHCWKSDNFATSSFIILLLLNTTIVNLPERRRKHRHQPDPFGEGLPRRAQHPQGVRDLHRRPDAHPQAQGRQERRGVGAVPQHRRRALAGTRRAGQSEQSACEGTHAQKLLVSL